MGSEISEGSRSVERISYSGRTYAVIVANGYRKPGIEFFTGDQAPLQLGAMQHPAGKIIAPHAHNAAPREIAFTHEVLFIRKGKLRVDFYDDDRVHMTSRVLGAGDVILLMEGGHGFEVLEDLEMIEVKQGPYAGENDKTRFEPAARAGRHSS
jgi:hypothetical protein